MKEKLGGVKTAVPVGGNDSAKAGRQLLRSGYGGEEVCFKGPVRGQWNHMGAFRKEVQKGCGQWQRRVENKRNRPQKHEQSLHSGRPTGRCW